MEDSKATLNQERGLDTRGIKSVLVARLQEALNAENPKGENATKGDVEIDTKGEAATEDTEADGKTDTEAGTSEVETDEMKEVKAVKDLKESLEGTYIKAGVVSDDARTKGNGRIKKREDCEMITMIGLPASGKVTWREKHLAENLEEQFTVTATTTGINKITMNGEPRRRMLPTRVSRAAVLMN